jgi:hypothetical protein
MSSVGAQRSQNPRPAQAASELAKAAGPAAGAAASASVGAAAGAAGPAISTGTDRFKSAAGSPFEGARAAAKGFIRGGCCLPPPPGLGLPDGPRPGSGPGGMLGKLDLEGIKLRMDASAAKANFDKVSGDALKDGRIDDAEQKQINRAGRDWQIADGKVDLHEAKKAHKAAVDDALKDGKITDAEQQRINDAQSKIDSIQARLTGLHLENILDRATDRKGDLKPVDPKLPDFKLPDFKLPDFKLPDFKLPDLKLPMTEPRDSLPPFDPTRMCRPPAEGLERLPFPSLPAFPQPPKLDFQPWLLQSPKL